MKYDEKKNRNKIIIDKKGEERMREHRRTSMYMSSVYASVSLRACVYPCVKERERKNKRQREKVHVKKKKKKLMNINYNFRSAPRTQNMNL